MTGRWADQANALLAQAEFKRAVATAEEGAAAGDAESLMVLATWRLIGSPLARDLCLARALIKRAVGLGHLRAIHTEIALTANGTGAPADWPAAIALLRRAALQDSDAARQLDLIESMSLNSLGSPRQLPNLEDLAPNGRVRRLKGLLTIAECEHVAAAAADLLSPTLVFDPQTGRQIPHPVRTSDGAVIGPTRETIVVQAINRRIAAATQTDWTQGEALTVLRYAPGQQYRPHYDVLPDTRNQRIRTVLLYLNDGFEGGETAFPSYRLTVQPRQGDAIVFDNTLPNGAPDRHALHSGEPVNCGTKWIATRWIRARAFSPWTGPEAPILG